MKSRIKEFRFDSRFVLLPISICFALLIVCCSKKSNSPLELVTSDLLKVLEQAYWETGNLPMQHSDIQQEIATCLQRHQVDPNVEFEWVIREPRNDVSGVTWEKDIEVTASLDGDILYNEIYPIELLREGESSQVKYNFDVATGLSTLDLGDANIANLLASGAYEFFQKFRSPPGSKSDAVRYVDAEQLPFTQLVSPFTVHIMSSNGSWKMIIQRIGGDVAYSYEFSDIGTLPRFSKLKATKWERQ